MSIRPPKPENGGNHNHQAHSPTPTTTTTTENCITTHTTTSKQPQHSMEESVQTVCRLLSDAVSSTPSPASKKLRLDGPYEMHKRTSYSERLRTFSSATYFAKPISLSPIVCAARGWFHCGVDVEDMLECSDCHAKLRISFDSKLTPQQKQVVTQKYEILLSSTGHAHCDCRFWERSQRTGSANRSSETSPTSTDHPTTTTTISEFSCLTVPLFLAKCLDPSFLELMEHGMPHFLLLERAKTLTIRLGSSNWTSFGLESWLGCSPPLFTHDDRSLLLEKVGVNRLGLAALLVLTGWTYPEIDRCADYCTTTTTTACEADADATHPRQDHDTRYTNNFSVLECKVCNATLRQLQHVVLSHRYYCPWRCGFPSQSCSSKPCWKVLAYRILEETTQEEDLSTMTKSMNALTRLQTLWKFDVGGS